MGTSPRLELRGVHPAFMDLAQTQLIFLLKFINLFKATDNHNCFQNVVQLCHCMNTWEVKVWLIVISSHLISFQRIVICRTDEADFWLVIKQR